jgi:hypothetical protein
MNENEMDDRGSKSDIIQNPQPIEFSVKEQRVDGSWFLAKIPKSLRCTLMDCESSYQIKILSKQLKSKIYSFSTLTNNSVNNIINL